MLKSTIFPAVLLLASNACGKDKKQQEPQDPPARIQEIYDDAITRIVGMLDQGYVVSRDPAPAHIGDALIWSGIALAVLPCAAGDPVESALLDMMNVLNGGLWRHYSLPDQISLDGAIGLYRGIAHRITACPGSKAKWIPALTAHLALNKLNPSSETTWPGDFKYVPELALAVATGGVHPDPSRLVALTGQVDAWTYGTVMAQEPCFRVNLGYQTLRTLEELGETVHNGNFCAETQLAGLATADHWCARNDGHAFIDNFVYNQWEYHPQRCTWEGLPDGKPGLETPALDLIEMIHESYTIPN